jgi:translation initiation factor 1
MSKEKISTDGGQGLGQNPFAALSGAGLPVKAETGDRKLEIGNGKHGTGGKRQDAGDTGQGTQRSIRNPQSAIRNEKSRGRVDIRRETGGRGGKTVTVIDGFVGIGLPEKELLAKKIRGACGCGGTVKDGAIEIQGDQRETIARILTEAGFRPVFAGG